MGLATALAIAALAGSIVSMQHRERMLPLLAVIASGLEVAIARRLVTFSIEGVRLDLVLGGVLLVCGVILFTRVAAKSLVAASTVIAFVGAVQVLLALRLI